MLSMHAYIYRELDNFRPTFDSSRELVRTSTLDRRQALWRQMEEKDTAVAYCGSLKLCVPDIR